MSGSGDLSDPVAEMLAGMRADIKRRAGEHEALRDSPAYRGAMRQIAHMLRDYGLGLNAIDLIATRNPVWFDERISLRIKPHFVQSMMAASQAIGQGLHDPAKREMRFLVEASVKALWLDQGSPPLPGREGAARKTAPANVAEKVAALDDLGRERFGEIVGSLTFSMLDAEGASAYRQIANNLYTSLSTTTHISSRGVERDLANFERGKHFAFETIGDVEAIARQMRQVLDLALASHFEAFDPGLVGDLMEPPLDDNWAFLTTPLVGAIDRHFDYKHERRERRGEI